MAREGSIARASEVLHITPQTISGQIKLLEESIGEPIFQRSGRGLVLTDTGHVVKLYADEIFSLGAELTQRIQSKEAGMPVELNVGMVSSIAKLITYRILEPALHLAESIRIVCTEASLEKLLGDLAVHKLDLVLSDRPIPTGLNVKAYNHSLGESGISFFAQKRVASKYIKNFPKSLHEAPILMPTNSHVLRRKLDDWLDQISVTPKIVAEFDDSALLKAFGDAGIGIFPAPSAISDEIQNMYHVRVVGTVNEVTENYYAISPERKLKHPGVVQITKTARAKLFI